MVARPFNALLSVIALFVATCDRSPVVPTARSTPTTPLTADDLGGDTTVVLVGAGDIVRCDSQEDEATAALLDSIPGIVFTVGDNVYAQSGIVPDFENCYGPSWGRHKARTRPAHGHMEPWQAGSTNYYNYFGAAAGESGKGYYSYDAGAWHVVVLNSDQSLAVGSPQDAWLNADLAARTKACLLAIWHHPRFSSSGSLPANDLLKPPWEALYAAGASLVVNSHYNVYERFAPQRPDGSLDPDRGIRQFTVGTGGISFSGFRSPVMPNSEARNSDTHGVLKLTLRPNGYDWQFVPQAGKTFTDTGSGPCFGPTDNLPPVARPGGPYGAENAVTFDGSASSDPDGNVPLSFLWDFGDGATDSGPTPTHAYAAEGAYNVTLTVTDARGGQGMATTTATIQGGPPTVDGGSDVRARPGRVTRLTFAFTDRDAYDGPWSYDVAWGDGAHSTGTTTTLGQPIEVSHVYSDAGQFTVPVAVTDKDSATGVDLVTITVSPPGTPEIIAGAGNIASCGVDGDEATAVLLDGIPGLVFTLGDNAFPDGSAADYARCYQPSWGRHRDRTRAVQGNHEYHSPGAAPSFAYWGVRAGPAGLGYYSYDVADWHVIVLNDQIAFSTGSTQYQWLQADLAANTARCTIAMWHVPLFLSSDDSGYIENPTRRVLWNALYAAGVDIVLNAQQHHYERFAPQTPAGALDAERGIREFNVGTGGESTALPTTAIHPNSQVRSAAFGVLKLTLRDGSYSWEFVPVPGGTFSDAGSGTCGGEAPNQAPTANAGGPYAADANVTFNGTGSSDPDNNLPLTYAWTFGDGTTGSGVSPAKTYTTNGTYTATLAVTDALGLASAPASTSVTIANIAPTVNAGADTSLVLGSPFQLNATFTDPGGAADAPWAWTVTWGDGATQTGSSAGPGGISTSHTYAAAGTHTVQVNVTDQDGGTGVDQATVTVLEPPPPPNQAPTANPGGPYAADATVAFDGTGSRDPDNNLPLSYAWDFGDATTGGGATPGHAYTTAGSYTVTLVVTDA
ncbi:MAG TPA: PKD domain-containing protein, partial [Gemmatimonadales bacterium]|nr:PKD domain-containing protein [Gemmatimonadales bacterium]